MLSEYKEILKDKKGFTVAKTQEAYKMFCYFIVGNPWTQWDMIDHKMHTKDPWIGVNGSSDKGICVCSWPSFLDCIKLHKLPIFPVDTAEMQRYYMTQTVKKPQRATVCQYMACMGVLNNYLAHLPMVFNSPMTIEETEGKRAIWWGWSSRNCFELCTGFLDEPVKMAHTTLPDRTRTLLQDLELIKRVMDKKPQALLPQSLREVPKSVLSVSWAAYTPYSTRVFLARLTRSDTIRVRKPDHRGWMSKETR